MARFLAVVSWNEASSRNDFYPLCLQKFPSRSALLSAPTSPSYVLLFATYSCDPLVTFPNVNTRSMHAYEEAGEPRGQVEEEEEQEGRREDGRR